MAVPSTTLAINLGSLFSTGASVGLGQSDPFGGSGTLGDRSLFGSFTVGDAANVGFGVLSNPSTNNLLNTGRSVGLGQTFGDDKKPLGDQTVFGNVTASELANIGAGLLNNPSSRNIVQTGLSTALSQQDGEGVLGDRKLFGDFTLNDLAQLAVAFSDGNFRNGLGRLGGGLGRNAFNLDPTRTRNELGAQNRSDIFEDMFYSDQVQLLPPDSPEAIASNQTRIDAITSQSPRLVSQLILGEEGLSSINQQTEAVNQAFANSSASLQSANIAVVDSATSAGTSNEIAQNAAGLAQQAAGRRASQDVLKDLAGVGALQTAGINTLAAQNLTQTQAVAAQSNQLDGLNQQAGIQNQKLATLQILQASQTEQLGSILNVQMHQQQLERSDRMSQSQGAVFGNSALWIPGLESN